MCTVGRILWLIIMLILSITDIKIRKVSVYVLVIAGIGSVVCAILSHSTEWWLLIGGAFVGLLFLLISKVTEEEMGYGDSLGILVMGLYLGIWNLLVVLGIAFFLLLCVLIPVLWKKRMSRKCTFPFFPFLTGGYICFLLLEGL